jgi:hypothetical protein
MSDNSFEIGAFFLIIFFLLFVGFFMGWENVGMILLIPFMLGIMFLIFLIIGYTCIGIGKSLQFILEYILEKKWRKNDQPKRN